MEVNDAIRTLLAVKAYKDEPVSEEDVQTILEAGRLSGSAHNAQPWHFVVVRDPEMRAEIAKRWQPSRYMVESPVAIGVFVEDNDGWGPMDGARAIQSMLLAAWELGLGSTWTGNFRFGEQARELLGVPEDLEHIGFVTLGYATKPVGKGIKNRKPLGAIAHRERFGQAYVEE